MSAWVIKPGRGMILQKRKPATFDRKVMWIEETERTTGKGVQVVLTPRWDENDIVRHRSADRRGEAKRMFQRFIDGKTTGLQPIDYGIIARRGFQKAFQGGLPGSLPGSLPRVLGRASPIHPPA